MLMHFRGFLENHTQFIVEGKIIPRVQTKMKKSMTPFQTKTAPQKILFRAANTPDAM